MEKDPPPDASVADAWIDRLADALGESRLTPREISQVLKLARDVAHGVERKLAPLAAFVAGLHVGRRRAEDERPEGALADSIRTAMSLVPAEQGRPHDDPSSGDG